MRVLRVSFVVLVGLVLSSFSEVPYEWKHQKIQFNLPDFFLKEKSNDFEFLASGNEMVFHLSVYMDELIEVKELSSFVSKIGKEKYGLIQSEGEAAIVGKGFKGYYHTGLADGNLVYVVGLRDNASGISYHGVIKYNGADNANRTFAKNIISSLEKYF